MKQLYRLLLIGLFFGVASCATTAPAQKPPVLINNQFQAVWDQLIIDTVDKLPQDTVSFTKLFSGGKDIILGDATRTLDEHANILQPFNKLAHPNGVCFKGTWNIYADTKYSGYFKKNSKALIIVRASTAMSNTRQGEIRSFGFAGKIFPTMNPNKILQENTANFFLIDDLGGTRAAHYTDVALTNEPSISKNSEVFKSFLYVLKLARTFSQVDKNPSIRQVYEISQLGESNNDTAITPRWMKVAAKQGQTVEAKDFRDELRITENKKLVFSISVASEKINNKKDWKNIGTIALDTSVISKSCDHRLHFHHPVWKSNLNH
jgi:hypothetical protein